MERFKIHVHVSCYSTEFILFNYPRLLTLSTIENVHKKRAHDKESRLSTVMVSADLSNLKDLASLNKTFNEKIQKFTKDVNINSIKVLWWFKHTVIEGCLQTL